MPAENAFSGLGVVVLAYGSGDEHVPLLENLESEGVDPGGIVVVQNPAAGSSDDVPVLRGETCRIRLDENRGYAAGMNAGIRRHEVRGTPLVLLLTHDARLRPGSVRTLLRAAEGAPDFGILGPVLWSRERGQALSYGGIRDSAGRTGQLATRPEAAANGIAECDWVEGSAMLVRQRVFYDAGLFDERFFLYFEETELCLRATRAGWRIGVVLDASAEHSPGGGRRPLAYTYLLCRNGLEHARLAAGSSGVVGQLHHELGQSVGLARICASPRSSLEARKLGAGKLFATLLGVGDFALRRFGPPPRRLLPGGDIRNATGMRRRSSPPLAARVERSGNAAS